MRASTAVADGDGARVGAPATAPSLPTVLSALDRTLESFSHAFATNLERAHGALAASESATLASTRSCAAHAEALRIECDRAARVSARARDDVRAIAGTLEALEQRLEEAKRARASAAVLESVVDAYVARRTRET